MDKPQLLLSRLDAIGRSLEGSGHALALLGLGSVGLETDRLDDDSDLDFFAIVEDGHKAMYIECLDWLSATCPIAYHFRNTADGHKLLFSDGVFCEFAVFEAAELRRIPFATGRVVWKQPHVDPSIAIPLVPRPSPSTSDAAWLLGEALTNLYVGLCRDRRGETLSAQRFIQHFAIDRTLELASRAEREAGAAKDPYSWERRFERRFPTAAASLPDMIQGYRRNRESALAILEFLESRFDVNAAMAEAIRRRCS